MRIIMRIMYIILFLFCIDTTLLSWGFLLFILCMHVGEFMTSVRYDYKVLFEQTIRSLARVSRIVLFEVTSGYMYQSLYAGDSCYPRCLFGHRLIGVGNYITRNRRTARTKLCPMFF